MRQGAKLNEKELGNNKKPSDYLPQVDSEEGLNNELLQYLYGK